MPRFPNFIAAKPCGSLHEPPLTPPYVREECENAGPHKGVHSVEKRVYTTFRTLCGKGEAI